MEERRLKESGGSATQGYFKNRLLFCRRTLWWGEMNLIGQFFWLVHRVERWRHDKFCYHCVEHVDFYNCIQWRIGLKENQYVPDCPAVAWLGTPISWVRIHSNPTGAYFAVFYHLQDLNTILGPLLQCCSNIQVNQPEKRTNQIHFSSFIFLFDKIESKQNVLVLCFV